MSGTIYLVQGDDLTPMRPAEPPNEDRLQRLIADHSNLIGEEDRDLLLVKREQGIADSEDGSDRWSIDHLFVTRDAVPVLVEVKRAVDTRLRREVVGQLLDYAANGALHWSMEKLRAGFEAEHGDGAEEALSGFLGDDERVAGFWADVEAHLRAGEMKLLIVADRIPPELARIIEFLNRQMRAEVYAIELRYYQSASEMLTLVPKVIGRTEETKARTEARGQRRGTYFDPLDDPAEWLAKEWSEATPAERGAGKRLCDALEQEGAAFFQRKQDMAICFADPDGKRVTPLSLAPDRRVYLGLHLIDIDNRGTDADFRERYLAEVEAAVGEIDIPGARLTGWVSVRAERIIDDAALERFLSAIRLWIRRCVAADGAT